MNQNINSSRCSAKAQKSSEQRYRQLQKSMRDAFAETDMQGRVLEFNDAFRDMLGYTDEELSRLTFMEITPEKWRAFEDNIIQEQVLKRGYSDVYEKEYRRKDGSIFPVELRTVLLADDAGNPASMWAIIRDISARKKVEEELRQREERFQIIARTTIDGVWDWDLATYGTWWNESFQALFGSQLKDNEPSFENWTHLIHPDDRSRVVSMLTEAIQSNQTAWHGEFRYRQANGAYGYMLNRGFILRDANGKPLRVLGSMIDITDRKQAEQERERLIKELEKALADIKVLRGLLPICAGCKKIRDDHGSWARIEDYIITHSQVQFSHGICPDCLKRYYPEYADERTPQ